MISYRKIRFFFDFYEFCVKILPDLASSKSGFSKFLKMNLRNDFTRTCLRSKGTKSWSGSNFRVTSWAPQHISWPVGINAPPPCRIGLKSLHNSKNGLKGKFVMFHKSSYKNNSPNCRNKAWNNSFILAFFYPFFAIGAPQNYHTPIYMVSNENWWGLLLIISTLDWFWDQQLRKHWG